MLCYFKRRRFRQYCWYWSDRSRWSGWSRWWSDSGPTDSRCYNSCHCTAESAAAAAADQLTLWRFTSLPQSPPGNAVLRNDLLGVERDVKPLFTYSVIAFYIY